MRSAKIFLVGENERQLAEMVETSFDKEDILQLLLERYPDLLPGDQIDPESPRRWLLVSREMGVPGQEKGTNIWSLDHLFLDQDGIPTFVECKRASDTRARREVVAQMLDYAANGISYWSIETLRQAALETALKKKRDLNDDIQALVSSESPADPDAFWKSVEQNLRSGRIRLIFVTDSIPRELRRLVEFLNEKMNDVEVLAVEIKQFIGQGKHKAIVPRVIGATETAREVKTQSGGRPQFTNREKFMGLCSPEASEVFEYMLTGAEKAGCLIVWGTVGFSIRYPTASGLITILYGYPPSRMEIYEGYLKLPEAKEKAYRKEVLAFGIFKEAGAKTLRTEVNTSNLDKGKER